MHGLRSSESSHTANIQPMKYTLFTLPQKNIVDSGYTEVANQSVASVRNRDPYTSKTALNISR